MKNKNVFDIFYMMMMIMGNTYYMQIYYRSLMAFTINIT